MKQIEAIVRREKFPDVDHDLRAMGVGGLTVTDAMRKERDTEAGVISVGDRWTLTREFRHRVMISLVVEDSDVKNVVDTIVASATTNSAGDGKVFVIPIESASAVSIGDAYDDFAPDLPRAQPFGEN